MVDAARAGQPQLPHGLENAQHAHGVNIGGVFRRIEAHLHVALCREVVNLGRAHQANHAEDAHGVAEVGVVEVEMRFTLQVGDAWPEVHGRATDDTVHVISLFKQELGEVRTVLACYARYEGYFPCCHVVVGLFLQISLNFMTVASVCGGNSLFFTLA